jgi:hypothetical protein
MICSIFMGNLVETGRKLKKLKHTGAFACIFDRHAKKFATDARRYVEWGRGSLGFQHISGAERRLSFSGGARQLFADKRAWLARG